MADFAAPRLARLDEFAEAMDFTDRVFRPGQKGRRIVQSQYPHAYREKRSHARRLTLLRDAACGDTLVGCLAIHPMQLRIGAATVSAGGIGIVGADPSRRGEGIMTRLLHDAVERMRANCQAISLLGGDRQRYGWFGWENGGVRYRYQLTTRMLGKPTVAQRGLSLQRFDPDDATTRRRLHRLASARPVGVEHSAADVAFLFHRVGRESWIIRDGRRFACVCLGGPGRRPRPYERIDAALGDPQLIAAALRRLMARFGLEHLSALAGPNPEEAALYEPWAASWNTQDDGMIRLMDLPLLIQQIQPEIRRRAAAARVEAPNVRLQIADLGQIATLNAGGRRTRRCSLSAAQAVQWLFGSRASTATGLVKVLPEPILGPWSALLPLPLHVPPLHHI